MFPNFIIIVLLITYPCYFNHILFRLFTFDIYKHFYVFKFSAKWLFTVIMIISTLGFPLSCLRNFASVRVTFDARIKKYFSRYGPSNSENPFKNIKLHQLSSTKLQYRNGKVKVDFPQKFSALMFAIYRFNICQIWFTSSIFNFDKCFYDFDFLRAVNS